MTSKCYCEDEFFFFNLSNCFQNTKHHININTVFMAHPVPFQRGSIIHLGAQNIKLSEILQAKCLNSNVSNTDIRRSEVTNKCFMVEVGITLGLKGLIEPGRGKERNKGILEGIYIVYNIYYIILIYKVYILYIRYIVYIFIY